MDDQIEAQRPTLGNVVRAAFAGAWSLAGFWRVVGAFARPHGPVSYQRSRWAGVAPDRSSPPTGHAWHFGIVCILQHVFVFRRCEQKLGLAI